MIGAALLIPATLWAAQVTISEVTAEREAGRIAITIKGDAMIDPEAASAQLGEGHLYLYVRDARVKEANRSWQNGAAEGAEDIRAHRHRQQVELAVPLGDGSCQGPVQFETVPGGLRALIECDGSPRPGASRTARAVVAKPELLAGTKSEAPASEPRRVSALRPAVDRHPDPAAASGEGPRVVRVDSKGASAVSMSAHEAAELKAKLALEPAPEPPAGDGAVKPPPSKSLPAADPRTSPSRSPVGAGAARAEDPNPLAPPIAAVPAAVAPAAPALAASATGKTSGDNNNTTSANSNSRSSSGGGGVILAGVVLLAIAGAAFFFSRRRRVTSRHIEILETASLGPKRSLIVARVDGARMILGSSEAGITLLQTYPEPDTEIFSRAAMPEDEPSPDVAEPMPPGLSVGPLVVPATTMQMPAVTPADEVEESGAAAAGIAGGGDDEDHDHEHDGEPQPVGQAGLLSRLFHRGTPANDATAPRFEDLLEDSIEDQELRRKLALGLPGRVR